MDDRKRTKQLSFPELKLKAVFRDQKKQCGTTAKDQSARRFLFLLELQNIGNHIKSSKKSTIYLIVIDLPEPLPGRAQEGVRA